MTRQPRVLIVDDHPLFRDALGSALNTAFPDGAKALHAETLEGASDILDNEPADLIMLDLGLPDTHGFDGLTKLQSLSHDGRFVIVSATETDAAVMTARSLGAHGYVPKSLPLKELCGALVTVLDGGTWFPAKDSPIDHEETSKLADRVASLTPAQHYGYWARNLGTE